MRENNDKVIHFEACYVKEDENDEFLTTITNLNELI